jgi:hypothetical protein
VALESTQAALTGKFPGVKGGQRIRLTTLPPSVSGCSIKMWETRPLITQWTSTACYDSFASLLYQKHDHPASITFNLTYYMFQPYFSVAFTFKHQLYKLSHHIFQHNTIPVFTSVSTWIPIIRSNCEISNYKCKTTQAVSKINLNEMYCMYFAIPTELSRFHCQ